MDVNTPVEVEPGRVAEYTKTISARLRPEHLELIEAWRRYMGRQTAEAVSYRRVFITALRYLPLPKVPDPSDPDYNYVLAVRQAYRKIWKER